MCGRNEANEIQQQYVDQRINTAPYSGIDVITVENSVESQPEGNSDNQNERFSETGSSNVASIANEDHQLVEEVISRIREMGIKIVGSFNFKSYSGQDQANCRVFLRQFEPYKSFWSEEEYFAHVENCLIGKASEWFQGAKRDLFKTAQEFEREFKEMFGPKSVSGTCEMLAAIRKRELELGKLENTLLALFEIEQSSINLKDILEVMSADIPVIEGNRLKQCTTWKSALLTARTMDEEFLDTQRNSSRRV